MLVLNPDLSSVSPENDNCDVVYIAWGSPKLLDGMSPSPEELSQLNQIHEIEQYLMLAKIGFCRKLVGAINSLKSAMLI
jgi:hypothetical protein